MYVETAGDAWARQRAHQGQRAIFGNTNRHEPSMKKHVVAMRVPSFLAF